jgi:predicted RNA-binding Zn ribbon-like protein
MGGKSGGRPSAFSAEIQARDCAIRNAIGRMLRAQYDTAEPLPDKLADLVRRLDGAHATGRRSAAPHTRRAPSADTRPLRTPEPATA